MTGFTTSNVSVAGKSVELLKEVAPSIARIAVFTNPETSAGTFLPLVDAAAAKLAIKVTRLTIRNTSDIERGIEMFAREPNGALVIVPDSTINANRDTIIRMAAQHRLPAIYPYTYFVPDGGLMAYGIDYIDMYRGAASYVDRLLRGTRPGDLPVQFPTKFELFINLKTAKTLGLEIPVNLLSVADKVIE